MKRAELIEKTDLVITTTREALQLVYDSLNKGQQKKIIKQESVKELFDRYGVKYSK